MKGVPGSGKSTLARALRKTLPGALILSTDEYFLLDNVYLFDRDAIHFAHKWNYWRCERAMMHGFETIIIDNTNTTGKERKPYLDLAETFGYVSDVVEPLTEWRYNAVECFKRNSHGVPLETICRMLQRILEESNVRSTKVSKGWEDLSRLKC
jgi:predicted kinase